MENYLQTTEPITLIEEIDAFFSFNKTPDRANIEAIHESIKYTLNECDSITKK